MSLYYPPELLDSLLKLWSGILILLGLILLSCVGVGILWLIMKRRK